MTMAAQVLVEVLTPERLTAVVDIGANPIDGDPPYKAMLDAGLCTVTGFEPQADARAELLRAAGPHETYLADAVGDGDEHDLHVTVASGMTSLFPPDPARLAFFNGFPEWGTVKEVVPIATRRLDDIAEVDAIDLLKIDIQGGELMVVQHGRRALARAVVIHAEVSFVPLYVGQPAFGELDVELRSQGFLPHAIDALKLWPIAPVVYDGDFRKPMRQVLEADVVYVRDPTRADAMDAAQLAHLSLLAHCVYGSTDLVHWCLAELVRRGAAPPSGPEAYLRAAHGGGA